MPRQNIDAINAINAINEINAINAINAIDEINAINAINAIAYKSAPRLLAALRGSSQRSRAPHS